jgi:hypothetical protein
MIENKHKVGDKVHVDHYTCFNGDGISFIGHIQEYVKDAPNFVIIRSDADIKLYVVNVADITSMENTHGTFTDVEEGQFFTYIGRIYRKVNMHEGSAMALCFVDGTLKRNNSKGNHLPPANYLVEIRWDSKVDKVSNNISDLLEN